MDVHQLSTIMSMKDVIQKHIGELYDLRDNEQKFNEYCVAIALMVDKLFIFINDLNYVFTESNKIKRLQHKEISDQLDIITKNMNIISSKVGKSREANKELFNKVNAARTLAANILDDPLCKDVNIT